tara:strand:+ start:7193 stop:7744 length:552 start_codon:yes stop_codon:yes gene_type:complete
MSDFSRVVEDYVQFDPYDIEERFGETALSAVMRDAQEQLDELISLYDFAESESEREFAIEQIGDFEYGESEAESVAEAYELDFLTDYMSQSYKYNMDMIGRYVELVGAGGGGAGGSYSAGGGFTPSPPTEEVLRLEFDDLTVIDDIDEYDEYLEMIDYSFWDLDFEIETELAETIGSFFDEFF